MSIRWVHFCALLFTALSLVPAGAHLFEMPNKINLSQADYFVVQGIYRGWALFALALIPSLAATLALAIMRRGQGWPFLAALLSFVCMAATLIIFFTWTYPANQATSNWTVVHADWQNLRIQWEYAHAVNAVMTFIAFCLLALSASPPGENRAAVSA